MDILKDTIIIIPARLGSRRLKNKMLLKIGNKSVIEHTYNNCLKSGIKTYVATDSKDIASLFNEAIITPSDLKSGTDRVAYAVDKLDKKYQYIINVQGDMPFIEPKMILELYSLLLNNNSEITTIATNINPEEAKNPSKVKIAVDKKYNALYFSRSPIPYGSQKFLHHIGIYGFTRKTLTSFIQIQNSELEEIEKLEQLRALDNGMKIKVYLSSIKAPISIDTQEDYDKAIKGAW